MNGFLANQQAQSLTGDKRLPGFLGLPGFPVGGEMTPLSKEASVALLCSASQRLWKASAVNVESLASALDYVPLAMYAASRYLQERWYWSFERYLKALEQAEERLPAGRPDFTSGIPLRRSRRLMATLLLSFRLLDGNSQAAVLTRTVFLIAGYCAPNRPVPLDLLGPALGLSAQPEATLASPLTRLYELGLLRWSENGPIVLDTQAELARRLDNVDKKALRRLVEAGLKICEEEAAQPGRGPLLAMIAPHLEKAAQNAETEEKSLSSRIWNRLGHAFWAHFELHHAQHCFEQALQQDERIFGQIQAEVAADCSILGRIHHEMGEFQNAKTYFLRAIEITEKVFSRDYPGVADDAVRLGRLMHETGDLHGARAMYERALAIHEKSYGYGPRHPSTGTDLYELGLVMFDMGLWEDARKTFERALSVHEWVYGPHHHTVHADLTQLGKTLRAAGSLAEAKDCFQRVIQVERKISENPQYNDPSTLNNLGLILQDMGNLDEARQHFERAMRIDEETLGPDHPNVARDANNLGCVLRDLKDLPAARVCFRRAIAINEVTRGPDHRDLAINASNLGRVLYALEDLNGARECFERVLAIDEKAYGPNHLEIANDCANLGTVLHELDEVDAARAQFERARMIYEQALPEDHPKIVGLKKSLERLKRRVRI